MYFRGTLSVDPSKVTRTSIVKPTRAFGRMLFHLTAGHVGDTVERETFTAIAILQQLNRALRAVGVTDLVRLAVNDKNCYLDEEGREDDMVQALDQFEAQVSGRPREAFESIEFVAQHDVGELRLLIDVTIRREHPPGVPPIDVVVCGTMSEFAGPADAIESRMQATLADQDRYETFVDSQHQAFARFVDALEGSLDTHIGADATESDVERCIVRPKDKKRRERNTTGDDNFEGDALFWGYYGWDDSTDYVFDWGGRMHEHGLQCRECTLVDADGASILTVGEDGFDAGENATLDPEAEFVLPDGGDVEVVPDAPTDSASDSWSGWSSGLDSGGDSGGSSCSSCSSCGSCGGD